MARLDSVRFWIIQETDLYQGLDAFLANGRFGSVAELNDTPKAAV